MTQVPGDWRERVLKWVLSQSKSSGQMWLWCHSGLTDLEVGESWGSSCLACCYGTPASQAGRSWRKVPLICVEVSSVKWDLGKCGEFRAGAPWVTWAHQIGGIHSSLLAKASMSHAVECSQVCVPPGAGSNFAEKATMDLTVIHMLPWFQGPTRPPDLRVQY
jgi:hypothetical protein